jgi:hypothetical protein
MQEKVTQQLLGGAFFILFVVYVLEEGTILKQELAGCRVRSDRHNKKWREILKIYEKCFKSLPEHWCTSVLTYEIF